MDPAASGWCLEGGVGGVWRTRGIDPVSAEGAADTGGVLRGGRLGLTGTAPFPAASLRVEGFPA